MVNFSTKVLFKGVLSPDQPHDKGYPYTQSSLAMWIADAITRGDMDILVFEDRVEFWGKLETPNPHTPDGRWGMGTLIFPVDKK